MGALLFESIGGGAASGLGRRAGFGFGWGNGSPIHTWEMLAPGGFGFDVGKAFMALGAFAGKWPGDLPGGAGNSFITAGQTRAALDYINQDQGDWASGRTTEGYGDWYANLRNAAGDVDIDGSPPNVVPFLVGGNALKTFPGAIWPGFNDVGTPASVFDPATGITSVTGVGFQPDLVVFLCCTSAPGGGQDGMRVMVGMMDAAGNQFACSEMGVFDTAATIIGGNFGYPVRMSEFRDDACIVELPDPYGAFSLPQDYSRSSFVSMDPDGFSVHSDVLAVTNGGYRAASLYLAYKVNDPTKGFFQVGTHVQGDTDLGPYPLDPEGVLLVGDSWSPSIDGSPAPVWPDAPPSTRAVMSVGGFDGITNRSTVGGCGSHEGVNPGQYYDDSAIVFGDTSGLSTLARALGSLGTLAASLAWDMDDGGGRPFGSLAFRVPFLGADPVMRNAYYLHQAPSVDGAGLSGEVDAGDPTAAEGIVIALQDDTLEMGQTWTDVDAT